MQNERRCGVLLPISSLPSKYGIGCFSKEAYEFVDHLVEAGQSYWQILPLGPTGYGDSPYQSFSTFAGNPYFISLEGLVEEGVLSKEDCESADFGNREDDIDYEKLYKQRYILLKKAYKNSRISENREFTDFCAMEEQWLSDFSLFMAVKNERFDGRPWSEWTDDIKLREGAAIDSYRKELEDEIEFQKYIQFKFYKQWDSLKSYANEKGIKIIGDIPIYVAMDSADAWANPKLFKLDANNCPIDVAGCPPDSFSATGQLWGNPIYDWNYHKESGFEWWIKRIEKCFNMYDVLRIDHFRGFDEYYAIPFGDSTAERGHWEKGPGMDLFNAIENKLGKRHIIAEDLGFVTESVKQLVRDSGYPNMKVLEFAFDSRDSSDAKDYLPHNYAANCVVYTGTHDNEPLMSWLTNISPKELEDVRSYVRDFDGSLERICQKLIALSMLSPADLCIIPMQDYLGLSESARMNKPSTLGNNWRWRLKKGQFDYVLRKEMYELSEIYGRLDTENLINTGRKDMLDLEKVVREKYNKEISDCSNQELYYSLLTMVNNMSLEKEVKRDKKKLYYISAEFLIGKLLSNNLINLGIYDEVKELLAKNGKDLSEIEEAEPEPSLGNGGLGRLAACFLDSIATLGLNGDGVGLNYHFGLFKQEFENNLQKETKNPWIEDTSWLNRTERTYTIPFGGFNVTSRMYDLKVTGYENRTNNLHLFDIESIDEGIVGATIDDFDKEDIKRNLTLFLYPDDSDDKGRLLRVYQQYFMVSSGARLIIDEALERGSTLHNLNEYVAIQINDTHPSMVIPELIRLLMEKGISMDEAIGIVSKCCAYTNHTILAEALEKWPIAYLEKVAPQILPIIYELHNRIVAKYSDKSVYIIDDEKRVHMAHMDIHYGYSVNGVAALHTDILKDSELKNFYNIYPEKFNNKTNGITFRRWLLLCNQQLTKLLEENIGSGFKKDAMELDKLTKLSDDENLVNKLMDVKLEKKKELKEYLLRTQNIEVDENSVFDIQVKRLHEYKRQQMNALYLINKYFEIKEGKKPERAITAIFGAKAAPAYTIAKDIIHLILCLSELVSKDPDVKDYLKIVMVENYNVTLAEKLIPAADIHEQISLASKEASGTSNMKFMLNGAVAIGTMDGANVEIADLVGEDNIYIFGESSDDVIKRYERADYVSRDYYEKNPNLKRAVDFIVSDELKAVGKAESLERLYNELLNKDWFMTFPDWEDYRLKKDEMLSDFEDRKAWAKKMIINIGKAGFFSSDRTIEQYNNDIWKL